MSKFLKRRTYGKKNKHLSSQEKCGSPKCLKNHDYLGRHWEEIKSFPTPATSNVAEANKGCKHGVKYTYDENGNAWTFCKKCKPVGDAKKVQHGCNTGAVEPVGDAKKECLVCEGKGGIGDCICSNCDGVGEEVNRGWEERFDRQFTFCGTGQSWAVGDGEFTREDLEKQTSEIKKIKSFFQGELARQKNELVEKLKGMILKDSSDELEKLQQWNYNLTIWDVIKELEGKE